MKHKSNSRPRSPTRDRECLQNLGVLFNDARQNQNVRAFVHVALKRSTGKELRLPVSAITAIFCRSFDAALAVRRHRPESSVRR